MSDGKPKPISREAVELLFSIIETPGLTISATVLDDYYCRAAAELKAFGMLILDGFEAVAVSQADHDDAMVSTTWDSDTGGYGYFSPAAGWVTVPDEQIARFRLDFPTVVARLMLRAEWPSRVGPVSLVPGLLWEIGDVRLGRRTQRVSIWFGRRLHDPVVWRQVVNAATSRPAAHLRIVLTSTPAHRLPDTPLPGHLVVGVRDVIDFSTGLSLHPDILAARLDGSYRPNVDAAIDLSPDGTRLTINGSVVIHFRSSKQIEIIRTLVARHKEGKGVRAEELLTNAGSSVGSLQRAFGTEKWKTLSSYLKSRNGIWGFET